jgi:hypothetical protein
MVFKSDYAVIFYSYGNSRHGKFEKLANNNILNLAP